MKAIVLHSTRDGLAIYKDELGGIRREYCERTMTTHGTLDNPAIHKLDEFLEWCFDETNCSDAYREAHKTRGMTVGDVLVVFDVGAFACLSVGWQQIE